MSEERVERRLAAILAADVAGYSRLMGVDEEGTLAALKAIRRDLVDRKIKEHRGRIVKTTGDGVLVEFASVVDAVRCAVEVQREMAERNADVPAEKRIEFRVGINVGDIISDDNDIYGDGVNVAARLEALAEPGGICVSGSAHEQVRDRLDISFDDMGEQQVKNIARPVRVYRVGAKSPLPGPSPQAEEGSPRSARVRTAGSTLPLPDNPSLAVLPFQNMTGDAEQEYFVDGMVEEITTAISRLPRLFVIARNSSFTYKGKAVDVKQVGRELGVRYVLEGSVRKAANRVRITGQLIDAKTGAHLWADRFEGDFTDIFDLQDRVASNVAGAIEPTLRRAEIERATQKPTESLDAYDLYLRAIAEIRKLTVSDNEKAAGLLQRALAIDPLYAPAAALLAECSCVKDWQAWDSVPESESAASFHLARLAIEKGDNDPDALAKAGWVIGFLGGELATALRAIDRALVLNPNSSEAWAKRGWVCAWSGQSEPAIDAFQCSIRLSPLDPGLWSRFFGIARSYFGADRFTDAMPWAEKAVLEQPKAVNALALKVAICGELGLIEEASQSLRHLLELSPGFSVERYTTRLLSRTGPPRVAQLWAEGLRKAGAPG